MKEMSDTEIAYLAGIFDGEGWYVSNDKNTCRVCVAMCDFDIVQRLHETTGVGHLNERPASKSKKAQLSWVVNTMDDVEAVINAMLPFLGIRKTKEGLEVLSQIAVRRERSAWRLLHFICGHLKEEANTYHTNQGKTVCRNCSLNRPKSNNRSS
jgi:hypothetical protein